MRWLLLALLLTQASHSSEFQVFLSTHPFFAALGNSRNAEIGALFRADASKLEYGFNLGVAGIHNGYDDVAIANPAEIEDVDIGVLRFASLSIYRKLAVPGSLSIGLEVGYNAYSKDWSAPNDEMGDLVEDKSYWTIGPHLLVRYPILKSLRGVVDGGINIDPFDLEHNTSQQAAYLPNLMLDVSIGLGFAF
jgi:hypothetical protein